MGNTSKHKNKIIRFIVNKLIELAKKEETITYGSLVKEINKEFKKDKVNVLHWAKWFHGWLDEIKMFTVNFHSNHDKMLLSIFQRLILEELLFWYLNSYLQKQRLQHCCIYRLIRL